MQLEMFKLNSYIKIFILVKFVLIYLSLNQMSYAENSVIKNDLVAIGNENAPIKIKVFSSLTCPHCAAFHIKVIPKIKAEYVKKGIVQLIFIDFPLDKFAFNASKLLYCLNKEKRISFLDSVYENQEQWTSGSNENKINNNLKNMVKNLGLNEKQFDACLINETISNKILTSRIEAHKKYSVESTPTIIINEKKLEGSASFKNIKKKIEKLI